MELTFLSHCLLVAALGGPLADDAPRGGHSAELQPPTRLTAGGEVITVDVGHAAPYLYDFNSNGKLDLIVGQFGQGRLRIYENQGTNQEPRYDDFYFFKAGEEYGTVPAG